MSVETPTDAQATMPMNLSLRRRRPTSQLTTALASGAKIISLRRLLSKKRISLFVFFHRAVSCNFVDHSRAWERSTKSHKNKRITPIPYDCGRLTTDHSQPLQFQDARIVNIQRFTIAKDGEDDPQAHGGFGRGDRHHDKDEQLSRDITKETGKSDKRQVHGVEHQLDAHEHRDHVALDHYAYHADREEHGGKCQIP